MTIHAFSRKLIDVTTFILSFPTFTYHKPLRLCKFYEHLPQKPVLSNGFQIWECHQGLLNNLSPLIVLLVPRLGKMFRHWIASPLSHEKEAKLTDTMGN